MTFGEYIETIHSTDLFVGGAAKIAADLFGAAGSMLAPINLNTAKSWLRNHRKCKIREHFPHDKVDEKGFIEFFSGRESSWKELQAAFRSMSDLGIVKVDAESPAVFYRSLLNQFQKIFRLLETEEPAEKMLLRFKEATLEYTLEDFFNDPLTASVDDLPNRINGFLKRIDCDVIELGMKDKKIPLYLKIKELSDELERFVSFASADWQRIFPAYRIFDEEIIHHLRRVVELYGEICGIKTNSNIRLTVKSPGFPDIDMKVINYSELTKEKDLPK